MILLWCPSASCDGPRVLPTGRDPTTPGMHLARAGSPQRARATPSASRGLLHSRSGLASSATATLASTSEPGIVCPSVECGPPLLLPPSVTRDGDPPVCVDTTQCSRRTVLQAMHDSRPVPSGPAPPPGTLADVSVRPGFAVVDALRFSSTGLSVICGALCTQFMSAVPTLRIWAATNDDLRQIGSGKPASDKRERRLLGTARPSLGSATGSLARRPRRA